MAVSTGSKVRLTRRALLLAGVETTFNTDPTLSTSTDAMLVMAPTYTVNPTVLTRDFVREDLSPLGTRIGRKLASMDFEVEFRGNGSAAPSTLGNECILARLLRGCGYARTSISGTGCVETPRNHTGNTNNPTWAGGGASTQRDVSQYIITCVKAGASATAKLRVSQGPIVPTDDDRVLQEGVTAVVTGTSATMTATINQTDPLSVTETIGGVFHAGDVITTTVLGVVFAHTVISGDTDAAGTATAIAALIDASALFIASAVGAVITITYASTAVGVVVTSATTALTLGTSGSTVTPTFSGSLTLGDSWTVNVYPVGISYSPISDAFESLTLYAYFDGLLHKLTGAYGTFSIKADAGSYATAKFTFTGQYHAPTDVDTPDATQETSIPPVCELGRLAFDSFQPVVNSFTFDQANTIVPRPDICGADGFNGTRITARKPAGTCDPEATLGATYDFWSKFAASTAFVFSLKIGNDVGNTILINAPSVQLDKLNYGDRTGLRTYDAGMSFNRLIANDEVKWHFC